MLPIIAFQVATAPIAPVAAPAAPPAYPTQVILSVSTDDRDRTAATQEFAIVVRASSDVLWQGSLRVAARGGESGWTQTKSEPPVRPCPATPRYYGADREMLTVSLSGLGRDNTDAVVVAVRWTRPGDQPSDAVRSVEVRQTVSVVSRQPVVVTGDGGAPRGNPPPLIAGLRPPPSSPRD